MEVMLQTKKLCKFFKKQKAVDNVSLHIEKGKIYGLLGSNGAGKSTILKMLTGMLKPDSGEILFDEKPWNRKVLLPDCSAHSCLRGWAVLCGNMYRRHG